MSHTATLPTILIVEDNAVSSTAYVAQLEGAGFQCVISTSGDAAVDYLREFGETIRAILLNSQLPDIDGLELLQDNSFITARWPVVVTTSDGSINRAIEAMRLGAFDFVVRPVAPARLIAILRSAVVSLADIEPAPLCRHVTADAWRLSPD